MKGERVDVIRCDICYKVFNLGSAQQNMKKYTKHHRREHKGQQSMFSQHSLALDDAGRPDFSVMETAL